MEGTDFCSCFTATAWDMNTDAHEMRSSHTHTEGKAVDIGIPSSVPGVGIESKIPAAQILVSSF